MATIGLTGGIASGKSTVASQLSEWGAYIIDADQIARQIVLREEPAWQDIVDFFGENILDEDGQLNRKKLGQIVFSDQAALDKLNRITHPQILKKINQIVLNVNKTDSDKIVIIDAPLLIETGLHKGINEIILIATKKQIQLKRLMQRDKISKVAAEQIISAQMPLEQKTPYATYLIDNSGTWSETQEQLKKVWQKISRNR